MIRVSTRPIKRKHRADRGAVLAARRYFHREDEAAERKAAQVLQDSGLRGVQPRFVEGFEASEKIRPCHYEAWFSLDALPRSAKD